MKKRWFLIILFVLTFSLLINNVYAEGEIDNETGSETEEPSTEPTDPGDETESKAELSNITINGTNVVCDNGDKKVICRYTITKKDVNTVKITYTPSDGASVDKDSITEEIEEGTTSFHVVVTSKDGNTKNTYYFEITKQSLKTDSTLKSLTVNGQEIALKEGTLKYQTNVSFTTKKIEITAVPNDEKAKILDFKENKASFDFFENSKEFKIKVQAEDGEITTYSVTVTKRSEADTTLKSLTIKNQKLEFSSDIFDYELKVLKNITKLDIDAKANNSKATVKITNPVLQVGENTVKIDVTNDGNTSTYTIKVTKLNEDEKSLCNLKTLKIDDYELDFKPDRYEYDLHILDENHLVIKAESKSEDADVEITGNLDLVDGSIIKIKVTYDEDYYNIYKINIIKDGTIVAKKTVSKKAAALVICFDIISMIILGIVNLKEKLSKKNKDKEINNINVKKKKDVLQNLNDVDII